MTQKNTRRRLSAATAGALASILLVSGAAAQNQQQPPTPQPEHQDPEQREQEELRRREDELRRQQQQEQERIQDARRRQQEQERSEQARRQQGIDREQDGMRGQAREASAPREPRALARQLFEVERRHRDLMARMDRVAEIYQQQGHSEALEELEQMRQFQNQRYMAAQERFREQLGPQSYARAQSMMQQAARRTNAPQRQNPNEQQRQDR